MQPLLLDSVAARVLRACPRYVEGRRLWGVAVQLYTVRSHDNWGIGDFSDLKALIRWLAPRGAGFIGLNPLHALAPADPQRASPYSASNRHFLNLLYIAVPGGARVPRVRAARARIAEPAFADRLDELRDVPHVDYRGVAEVKFEILELLFRDFCDRHLALGTERAAAFRSFVAAGGPLLQMHARFDALDQHFRATQRTASGWLSWPAGVSRPEWAPRRCASQPNIRAQVEFYLYLQWLAHEQLTGAQALARELGMPIGLYGDYAVGTHPSGSETWVDQTGYRLGAEIGAPPDALALKGQGWGIPPPDPVVDGSAASARLHTPDPQQHALLRCPAPGSRDVAVPPVVGGGRAFARHRRLCPLPAAPTPHRAGAGERAQRLCGRRRGSGGRAGRDAPRYGRSSGSTITRCCCSKRRAAGFGVPTNSCAELSPPSTTHDMPTLRSFWEGRDIELRRQLQLYPSAEISRTTSGRSASATVWRCSRRCNEQGLQPASSDFLVRAVHARARARAALYLARSKTRAGRAADRGSYWE